MALSQYGHLNPEPIAHNPSDPGCCCFWGFPGECHAIQRGLAESEQRLAATIAAHRVSGKKLSSRAALAMKRANRLGLTSIALPEGNGE